MTKRSLAVGSFLTAAGALLTITIGPAGAWVAPEAGADGTILVSAPRPATATVHATLVVGSTKLSRESLTPLARPTTLAPATEPTRPTQTVTPIPPGERATPVPTRRATPEALATRGADPPAPASEPGVRPGIEITAPAPAPRPHPVTPIDPGPRPGPIPNVDVKPPVTAERPGPVIVIQSDPEPRPR
jgi:hypothetical protein